MRKVIVLNYADENYKNAQQYNSKTATEIGKADEVLSYGPADISLAFKSEHSDIFSYKRGAGLWLWKPYIVKKALQNIDDGDVLFYCDSGAYFTRKIDDLLKRAGKFNLLVFDLPLVEEQFTKKATFEKMGCTSDKYKRSNQIMATYFVMIKNEFTKQFVDEWLNLCSDIDLLAPSDGKDEIATSIAHREDQSIFSLLYKKYGIEPQADISQRRWVPRTYNYDMCEYVQTKHKNSKLPVVLYLHKMKSIDKREIFRQKLREIKTQICGRRGKC